MMLRACGNAEASMRLFIAVLLPDEIKARLKRIQNALKEIPSDVAWAAPDALHITLKFIGTVPASRCAAATEAANAAGKGIVPFTVSLQGAGAFPSREMPRILWAGINAGSDCLAQLAARVELACCAAGFEKEERQFNGHLTLGRVRSRKNIDAVMNKAAVLLQQPIGEVPVEEFAVMRSICQVQGARYTCLQTIML